MSSEDLHLSDMLLGAFLMLTLIMLGASPISAFGTMLFSALTIAALSGRFRRLRTRLALGGSESDAV